MMFVGIGEDWPWPDHGARAHGNAQLASWVDLLTFCVRRRTRGSAESGPQDPCGCPILARSLPAFCLQLSFGSAPRLD